MSHMYHTYVRMLKGQFRLWPNFERRSVWTNENVELPKVRPLGLHTRGRSPKGVPPKEPRCNTFRKLWCQEFGLSSKILNPHFCREAELFFSKNIQNLTLANFNILFQPKRFSSRLGHSLNL